MKTAFITGATGQDGSYLIDFLLKKGYKVEFICFSEKLIGEIHRVNRKDKTYDIIADGIIYPNAKTYKKGGLKQDSFLEATIPRLFED